MANEVAVPTANRLYKAALELFASKGYEATGIRDLADAAGISTASLYHYMVTKQDLLRRIEVGSMSCLLKAGHLALEGLTLPEQQIGALVQVHVLSHGHYRLETLVADNELRSLTPANLAQTIAMRDEYERIWRGSIQAGSKSALFHIDDPRLACSALMAMCTGVARWYSPSGRLSLQALAVRYVDMSLQLLGALRSNELLSHASLRLPAPAHYEKLVNEVWRIRDEQGILP
jgi:AcrR family transcriptional regulator